jgi:hypothetical protein
VRLDGDGPDRIEARSIHAFLRSNSQLEERIRKNLLTKLRSFKTLMLSGVLAAVLFNSSVYACAARRVIIENTWPDGNGQVRLHILYLVSDEGGCIYM